MRFHLDWVNGKAFLCGPCDTCKTFLTGVGCKVYKNKKVEYIHASKEWVKKRA